MSKIESAVSNTFVRDGFGVTAPVIRDTAASYTPGVSERRGSTSTFLHSGLKNAETQTNASSVVSATKNFDAYGNVVSSTGTWQGPFGYAGGFGYQEDVSGLKLLGHRYYDSSTGRFLTRDPAKDGRNWYGYCANNPITSYDNQGLNNYYIGGGGQFIVGVFSFSMHLDICLDIDNGDLGINPNFGFGPALGIGASAGIEGGIDHNSGVGNDIEPTKGWAQGFMSPVFCAEVYDRAYDDDAWWGENGGGGGDFPGGGLSGPGAGGGFYREKRLGTMFPVLDLW